MKTIHIREMLPEDIPSIVRIERSSFSTPWSETSFQSEVHSRYSTTRVAEFDGAVVGYLCVKQIADECHLMDLAVHQDYRRMGIASELLADVLRDLREGNCRHMYLEVRESNTAARRLYEKFGFRPVGIRKRYYLLPDEDALVMALELGPDVPA